MMLISYIAERLPWVGAGLLAGFLLGIHVRYGIKTTTEAVMPEQRRWWRPTAIQLLGTIMVLLGLASAVQGYVQSQATATLTACLVTYANANADAIDARSKANIDAQQAQLQVWRTVYQQTQTEEGRAAARRTFEDYLNKQDEAIKTQQRNPFPAAPRDVCPNSGK